MHVKYQLNPKKRFVKTVNTKNKLNCINLQLAIRTLENSAFRTCTTPSQTFRPILRSIGLLDIKIPQKKLFPQTTNGRTDGQTSRTKTIGSFFSKKEKNTKKCVNANIM